MRRLPTRAAWLVLPLLVATASCEVSSHGPPDREKVESTPEMMPANEVDSIAREVRATFIERFGRGGADTTLAAMYAPDAIFSDETGTTHNGAQIRNAFASMPPGTRLELTSFGPVGSGDLNVDIGTYVVSFTTPGGQQIRAPGRYMIALQRMNDDSWRVVRQISSADPTTRSAPGSESIPDSMRGG